MSTMSSEQTMLVSFGMGTAENPVLHAGSGDPLVFLHGPYGQEWPSLLDDLAATHTVYAPAHPGSVDSADLEALDNQWELVQYYDDLFAELGIDRFTLVGHSFGGMIAAEYAAAYPDKVERLILIDSMGLWLDDAPVADFVLSSPAQMMPLIYSDPDNAITSVHAALPEDRDAAIEETVHRFNAVASAAHFCFPIPDRGLRKRLRRIKADTLLVWGQDDGFVPAVYAQSFAELLPTSHTVIVPGAGHYPHVEQRDAVLSEVTRFLDSDSPVPSASSSSSTHRAGSTR